MESVSRSPKDVAHVFLKRDDGVVLRVPLRSTSLASVTNHTPRSKLSYLAVREFLELVKEYELCPTPRSKTQQRKSAKSGRRSIKNRDTKS